MTTKYISLQNLGVNWGPSSHQSTLHNRYLQNPLAKWMSPHLPVLSSHREWQASGFILDMEAAEICDTDIDVLYVLLFLHVGTDFQACWMLKDASKAASLLCLISYRQCTPLTLLPQFPICNIGGDTITSPQVVIEKSNSWPFIKKQDNAMKKIFRKLIIPCSAQILSSVQEIKTGPHWIKETKKYCVDAQRASVQSCS